MYTFRAVYITGGKKKIWVKDDLTRRQAWAYALECMRKKVCSRVEIWRYTFDPAYPMWTSERGYANWMG